MFSFFQRSPESTAPATSSTRSWASRMSSAALPAGVLSLASNISTAAADSYKWVTYFQTTSHEYAAPFNMSSYLTCSDMTSELQRLMTEALFQCNDAFKFIGEFDIHNPRQHTFGNNRDNLPTCYLQTDLYYQVSNCTLAAIDQYAPRLSTFAPWMMGLTGAGVGVAMSLGLAAFLYYRYYYRNLPQATAPTPANALFLAGLNANNLANAPVASTSSDSGSDEDEIIDVSSQEEDEVMSALEERFAKIVIANKASASKEYDSIIFAVQNNITLLKRNFSEDRLERLKKQLTSLEENMGIGVELAAPTERTYLKK